MPNNSRNLSVKAIGCQTSGGNISVRYEVEGASFWVVIPEEALQDAFASQVPGERLFEQDAENISAHVGAHISKLSADGSLDGVNKITLSETQLRQILNLGR